MTFRVGQKVVCVDADASSGHDRHYRWGANEAPQNGAIYTITAIYIARGVATLNFVEIRRDDDCVALGHTGYAARRFRPIVERKTDISIFKKMLTPHGVEA